MKSDVTVQPRTFRCRSRIGATKGPNLQVQFAKMALWRFIVIACLQVSFGLRRLEETTEDFEYDLGDFFLRFEKCQFVKMYNDELAQKENTDSPLALKHFVVFKLCDDCQSCSVYGSYVLEVDDYLEYTIENQRQGFQAMCENCSERCNGDDESCSGCAQLCYQYENLEAIGSVDAAEYAKCQKWEPEDGGDVYYIGPRCNSGNSIAIGVFADENCWDPVDDVDIEDLLGVKLSYHLLRHTYSSVDQVCLSCSESAYAEDDDKDNSDGDSVNEMCENLYDGAAKCESKTGLENGFVQVNKNEQDYQNQVENEFMACTFINSLVWNSYTETGEINWKVKQDVSTYSSHEPLQHIYSNSFFVRHLQSFARYLQSRRLSSRYFPWSLGVLLAYIISTTKKSSS
jgi:hypothetical protein